MGCVIDELQFRTVADVNEVMVYNSIISSSIHGSSDGNTYQPVHLFDASITSASDTGLQTIAKIWRPTPTGAPHHVGLVFAASFVPQQLYIRASDFGANNDEAPKDFDIEYSPDNGTNWVVSNSLRGVLFTPGEEQTFDVSP